MDDSDFISYLFAGLSTDYGALVNSITTRVEPINSEDAYAHLLTHEMRLEHQATSLDLSASSVNAAVKGASSSSGSNQWYPNSQSFNNSSSSGYFSNCCRALGNQQFSYGQAPRVICQVCNKPSHSAMNCFYRFDHAFQSAPRTPIQLPHLLSFSNYNVNLP